MAARTSRAFTLIELIVVMAIIVTLSVIGFISYNSYIQDSRNAAREAELNDIVKSIDQFIVKNAYAPTCANSLTPGTKVCFFVDDTKKVAAKMYGSTGNGGGGGGSGAGTGYGITGTDFSQLNLKSSPEDPRKVYFLYAYNGSKYAIMATKELSNGFSTIIKGSQAYEGTGATTALQTGLGLGNTIDGHSVRNGVIQSGYPANPRAILYNNYSSTTNGTVASPEDGAIPYYW